jgi:F-type H+-transporting ATPase subunit alpha
MKLDLAQFRELEAFAQFSSDLDDRTKAQLERGERVNAVLKQGWDTPLKVEERVVVIFAAVRGYLDQVIVSSIPEWERRYLEYVHASGKEILDSIIKEQKILEETEQALIELITSFNSVNKDLLQTTSE